MWFIVKNIRDPNKLWYWYHQAQTCSWRLLTFSCDITVITSIMIKHILIYMPQTATLQLQGPKSTFCIFAIFRICVFKTSSMPLCHQQGELWLLRPLWQFYEDLCPFSIAPVKKLQGFKSSTESDQLRTDR